MSGSDDFLSRWSRRKHAANRGEAPAPEPVAPPPLAPAAALQPSDEAAKPPAPLPPVESLTPESDFTGFMQEGVDPLLRRQALKTLFRAPRFNVMDGLDVYIDDYSKPDPIPPEWLGKLNQMARLGDYKPPEGDSGEGKEPAEAERVEPEQSPNQVLEPDESGSPAAAQDPVSPAPESQQS